MGGAGGSYRELAGKGRNGERRKATVRDHNWQINVRNGIKKAVAVSCENLPGNDRNLGVQGAARG